MTVPGTNDWFLVHIFPDAGTMRAWIASENRVMGKRSDDRLDRVLAQTDFFTMLRLEGGRWRRKNQCGQVLFYRNCIGPGLVAHEMTHAASFYLFNKRGLKNYMSHQGNESLAQLVGSLTKQFWRKVGQRFPRMRYSLDPA